MFHDFVCCWKLNMNFSDADLISSSTLRIASLAVARSDDGSSTVQSLAVGQSSHKCLAKSELICQPLQGAALRTLCTLQPFQQLICTTAMAFTTKVTVHVAAEIFDICMIHVDMYFSL